MVDVKINKERNILILIILLLGVCIFMLYNKNNSLKTKITISEQNIKSLSDTVRITKNRLGDAVYSKNILISDKRDLEDYNVALNDELKNQRGKVRQLNIMVAKLSNGGDVKVLNTVVRDSLRIDTINSTYGTYGLEWEYDTLYSDSNRRLIAGISKFKLDSSGVTPLYTNIKNDVVQFKLVTGLREKDGNVEIFVNSGYPGFDLIDLDGSIIDPQKHPLIKKFTKKPKWSLGPYVGIGLDNSLNPNVQIGIGLGYSLFRF